ncbi:MAG TPA: thioredoxin domain-containing protein [Pirellulales bacterium]|nr:thioredoxin domain-containing protein [Pirellulales bacterium]
METQSLAARIAFRCSSSFIGCAVSVAFTASTAYAQPPTKQKPPAEERPANRLAKETSPYLLLHAHNPVDWRPWGEEALAKAKAENKLIFLSVGYSSCYWCHVMERESFMDDEVAAYLNKHFVCIKVDREERPDIDEIYMSALHALGRPGGWPLTMFLTPDARPFFGGTYFPPRDKQMAGPKKNEKTEAKPDESQKITGLLTLLTLIEGAWQKTPDDLLKASEALAAHVKQTLARRSLAPAEVAPDLADQVMAGLGEQYDDKYGGFGPNATEARRPKFPEPSNLLFLLDRVRRTDDADARRMLVRTLEAMAAGGMRDHVGGGFHRYSTDRFWRIPHFEKMLYDNAQLATVYAEASELTERDDFRQVAREILEFIRREMTDTSGGFYAALDAETDGDEGAYYVWTRDELQSALDADEYELLADAYGASGEPNFEGRYVLLLARPLAETAAKHKLSLADLNQRLAVGRKKLLAVRDRRKRPLTDTKILTGWNGLMIRGLADAGRVLDERQSIDTAVRAAEAVLEHLRTPDGRLLHTYTAGEAKLNAYLDDYAFLVDGLLALHRATGDRRWLTAADELTDRQVELFWDERLGGFFFTSGDHEELFARSKDPIDSATPSGNAVSAGNLAALAAAMSQPKRLDRAKQTIAAFGVFLNSSPAAMPRMALSWQAVRDADKADQ